MKDDVRDFIGVFENAVSDKWCDSVIDFYNFLENSSPLKIKNRQIHEHSPPTTKKNSFVFMQNHTQNPNVNKLYTQFLKEYLFQSFTKYLDRYYTIFKDTLGSPKDIKIQKTLPEEGYHLWHYEIVPGTENRFLVYMVYLNDVEEGGETEFLYQKRRIKPKKGTILIFPATFTHTHRGNPPLSGEKYAITGWVNLKTRKM